MRTASQIIPDCPCCETPSGSCPTDCSACPSLTVTLAFDHPFFACWNGTYTLTPDETHPCVWGWFELRSCADGCSCSGFPGDVDPCGSGFVGMAFAISCTVNVWAVAISWNLICSGGPPNNDCQWIGVNFAPASPCPPCVSQSVPPGGVVTFPDQRNVTVTIGGCV